MLRKSIAIPAITTRLGGMILALLTMLMATSANAVPSFARQMGGMQVCGMPHGVPGTDAIWPPIQITRVQHEHAEA